MRIMRLALCARPFASRAKSNAVRLLSAGMRLDAGVPEESTGRVLVVLQDKGQAFEGVRTAESPDFIQCAQWRGVRAVAWVECAHCRAIRGWCRVGCGVRAVTSSRRCRACPGRATCAGDGLGPVRARDVPVLLLGGAGRASSPVGGLAGGGGGRFFPERGRLRVIRIPHFAEPRPKKSRFASEGAAGELRFSHTGPRQHA